MPVLCLDTASATPTAVVLGRTPHEDRSAVGEGRAQDLLVLIDELLTPEERDALEAVVVGVGPGGFTGLRVGVATARGIAETLDVPLYALDSMLARASLTATAAAGDTVWAVIDARRGDLFVQPFACDEAGRVTPAGSLHAIPVGEFEAVVADARRTALTHADPASLAHAARQLLSELGAGAGDPLQVVPRYGREPDAEPRRMQVRYDRIHPEDVDAMLALERRCFPTPWSASMVEEELRRPAGDAAQFAARDAAANDKLVGAAFAARLGDSWHIMNVLVDPAARRRGIATHLLDGLLAATAELGIGEGWTLEVDVANAAAIALYERAGFTRAGVRPGYYQDTGADALVMWRRVEDDA